MGNFFSKQKNDPKVIPTQIENYYLAMKGEMPMTITKEDMNFRTEAVRVIQYNWSLLHLAVWFMNKDMVAELLKQGFDVNLPDVVAIIQHQDTPLHIAGYQRSEPIYELLLENGANNNAKNRVRHIQEDKTPEDLLHESS